MSDDGDNGLGYLKARLSQAREAQKAADSALGLIEVLVNSLEGLGLAPFVDISGVDSPSARVVVAFSVQTGVILAGSSAAVGLVAEGPSPSAEQPSRSAVSTDAKKPPQQLRRWTRDEVARARRMRSRGQTARHIAEVLGRPVEGVKSKLHSIEASASTDRRKKAPRWSDKEIATAKRLLREGAGPKEISRAVGRSYQATSFKLRSLRKEVAEEDAGGAEARPAEPGPQVPPAGVSPATPKAPEAAASGRQGAPVLAATDAPMSDRQVETVQPAGGLLARRMIERRLDKLGYAAGWDPDLDLEMVELLLGGTKAQDVAIILEMTRDQVVKRFQDLCPDPTIDKQEKLLGVLRARAGKEEKSA